ncbi:MAG: 50S ribosomal protein L18 [Candidatus Dojkabacteria bacterium]
MLKKQINRHRRKRKVRGVISGKAGRPRLSVFRSNNHIYAQLVDDESGKTLVQASDVKMKTKGAKSDMAKAVGSELAKKAKTKKISKVVFDRNGYKFHGRVKSLAEAAREGGLKF